MFKKLSSGKKFLIISALVVLPSAGVVTSMMMIHQLTIEKRKREAALPSYGTVPDFHLIEASGKPFSLADLKGKIWITDFIYTHCDGSCPMMTSDLSQLDTTLRRMPDIKFVSISVDPSRDTPAELVKYAEMNHLSRARWYLLTGAYPDIRSLAKTGFRLSVGDSANEEGLATHSSRFALIDRTANIRGYYDGTDSKDIQRMVGDVNTIEQEEGGENE